MELTKIKHISYFIIIFIYNIYFIIVIDRIFVQDGLTNIYF